MGGLFLQLQIRSVALSRIIPVDVDCLRSCWRPIGHNPFPLINCTPFPLLNCSVSLAVPPAKVETVLWWKMLYSQRWPHIGARAEQWRPCASEYCQCCLDDELGSVDAVCNWGGNWTPTDVPVRYVAWCVDACSDRLDGPRQHFSSATPLDTSFCNPERIVLLWDLLGRLGIELSTAIHEVGSKKCLISCSADTTVRSLIDFRQAVSCDRGGSISMARVIRRYCATPTPEKAPQLRRCGPPCKLRPAPVGHCAALCWQSSS